MFAIISLIFGFIEVVVGLRFLFLLFAANPLVPLVGWVHNISYPLVAPFIGILGQTGTALVPLGQIHSVFDISTLIALVVYAAIGGFLMSIFSRRSSSTSVLG
jgi:hypothetical protein